MDPKRLAKTRRIWQIWVPRGRYRKGTRALVGLKMYICTENLTGTTHRNPAIQSTHFMNNTSFILSFRCCLWFLFACAGSAGAQGGSDQTGGPPGLVRFEWSNTAGTTNINPVHFLQDSRGLMWMASTAGVVSFDGYNFKVYGHKEYNLSTSRVIRLAEDIHGNIWIMGFRNSRIVIDVMNPQTETVLPLHRFLGQEQPIEIPLREEIILLYNINGKIWVGTIDAGYLYDGTWQQVYAPGRRTSSGGRWWPAPGGFWSVNSGKKYVYLENSAGELLDSVPADRNKWLDDQLHLWTASADGSPSFHQLTVENGRILLYQTSKLPLFKWMGETIWSKDITSPHRYGYSWRITESGLLLSRSDKNEPVNLTGKFPDIDPVSHFYFDRQGGIWTATKTKIIHLRVNNMSGFRTIMADESLDRSMRGMVQTGNLLYVNSYKGDFGINLDDYSTLPFNILDGQGLCLLRDQQGFWAGGHGGKIARIEPGKSVQTYKLDYQPDINCFLRTEAGILTATSSGLFLIDPASGNIRSTPLRDAGVNFLYRNRKGVWVCTSNGLYLADEQGNIRAQYLRQDSGLRYEHLSHLYEDENGIFWVATRGGGLIEWSEEKGTVRQFTTSEGLSNNDIHAVYPDSTGCLWLPSNYGLMRMNKASGRIQVFFKRDGIADSEFNGFSHFQLPDGRLFLGGVNGVTTFNPKDIPVGRDDTPLLKIIEARTFQLKSGQYINHMSEIGANLPVVITPNDDYFDLSVSPLIYEDINQIRYSWKIEGYSDNWVQQQSPLIKLHNLPYGTHILHIRYSMQGNIWSENELKVPLNVLRPFYLTWPFLLLLAILMLGMAWGTGNWRARQLRASNLRLEQEVKRRTRQIESDKQLIEQQAKELRSLDEAKSRFFANITHELRTPLTLIIGPAENLLKTEVFGEKPREYLYSIRRNASKLLNLVEELLDLSKIEANKLVLNEKPVRLHQFLSRTLAAFTPYAEHRGITIIPDLRCQEDVILLMDVQKWEKIINNLLNNAIKFTPRGGKVTLTADLSDDELVVSVEDTGMGIPSEDLPYIFDRYYQARTAENAQLGGAGIGLSLCREYIRLFGGEITAESTQGTGSRFTLMCAPARARENPQPGVVEEPVFIGGTELAETVRHDASKSTILLVEDDRDMSDYVQGILNTEYNLLIADNGVTALQILEKMPVDLVLSDLMMPEMDGFQLLKTVRERYQDLPFIMLTARADAPDRLSALTLGVDDYLTKPFLEDELLARLKNLISRYDARRAAQAQTDITGIEMKFDQLWLGELEQTVNNNLGNPDFSLDDLAEILQISRRSLYNKTITFTGLTPSQYLQEARLTMGRRLLASGGHKTLAEVCYAVGMKTPDYFSKLMKERFG